MKFFTIFGSAVFAQKCEKPTDISNPNSELHCIGAGGNCGINEDFARKGWQAYLTVPGQTAENTVWTEAQKYCESMGMNLATVANEQEHKDLMTYTVEYGKCMTNVTNRPGNFFIALNRVNNHDEFKWTYRNAPGEEKTCLPYEFGDGLNKFETEDKLIDKFCVYMESGSGSNQSKNWKQVDCNKNPTGTQIGFVCQPRRDVEECKSGAAGFSSLSAMIFMLAYFLIE
ncbi:Oidioi.mRNA.OKI2018_I69.chr1.g742.t1.cds [Oikopleura dioica]|uniref:Oidioi.mRNA.OKI2018_I69.chr1.g742.t1.cds n=1 Tax=Oikopleura dioica TaxID=34765 RepID=A0ABN7SQY8_OIKDI|nr:Oidioi.mRNA.OKI2018_I69.chr1.g742.t1.cds [Oikopleura dioica]